MSALDLYDDARAELDPDDGEIETTELVVTDDVLVKAFALGPGFSPDEPTGALATPTHRHVVALFGVALAFGLAALLVAPGESELFLGIGTAAGGVLAWSRFGERAASTAVELTGGTLAVGGGGLAITLAAMSGTAEFSESGPLIAAVGAVGAVCLLALPAVVSRTTR